MIWSCPEDSRNSTECMSDCIMNGTYCAVGVTVLAWEAVSCPSGHRHVSLFALRCVVAFAVALLRPRMYPSSWAL